MNEPRDTYSVWYLYADGRKQYHATFNTAAAAGGQAVAFRNEGHSAQVVRNHHVGDGVIERTAIFTYDAPGMPTFKAKAVQR